MKKFYGSGRWDCKYLDKKYELDIPTQNSVILRDALESGFSGQIRVLDIGCGAGRHLKYFHENGFKVSGFDISIKAQESARKRISTLERGNGIDLKIVDMRQIPWPYDPESFEGALANDVIHHTNYECFLKIISEITRVLVPGGLFLAEVTSKQSLKYGRGPKLDDFSFLADSGTEAGIPHCFFSEQDIKSILSNKYNIINITPISGETYGLQPYSGEKLEMVSEKEFVLGHIRVLAKKK